MYSQVQVLIPIHGYTIECAVKIKFMFCYFSLTTLEKTILMHKQQNWYLYNILVMADSDTIKNAGIGLILIQISRISAALNMHMIVHM